MPLVQRAGRLESMVTTYAVNWRNGKEPPIRGRLRVTPNAVVFVPIAAGRVEEVRLADIPAVHTYSSSVELDRDDGDPIRIESAMMGMLGEHLQAAVERAATLHTLRSEHGRILEDLGELRVAVDSIATAGEARSHEVAFLAADLMRRIVRHAHVEERELYPAVEALLGCRPLVEVMVFDHRAIEGEACDLVRVEPGDLERLACVFHRLDALVTTHMAKEEAIVLPLLDAER